MDIMWRSRRDFLRLSGIAAGALCLGGLLEACGGSAAPASSAAGPASAKPAGSASAAASPAGSAAAKAGIPKLTVSYGSPVGSFAPLWMAKEIGAFDKYGVAVEMPLIETATAMQSMIAGGIDVQEVSAAPVITADLNGKLDIVFIASCLNRPILALYTKNSITSADQLKGKIIASDKPGTPVDYSAQVSLKLLGLKPSDVQIRPIGNAADILAAMLSGQVDAGIVAPPQSFQVEGQGFHVLRDIFDQPYQNTGLVARKSRFDQLAAGLKPLLAAYRDGIAAWKAQPDLALKVLDQYAKIGDPVIAKKTYDFYSTMAAFEPSMQPTMQGIQAMVDFLSDTVPAAKNAKADQFVDLRFLSDLPKA